MTGYGIQARQAARQEKSGGSNLVAFSVPGRGGCMHVKADLHSDEQR